MIFLKQKPTATQLSFSLPKSSRLLKPAEFEAVLKGRHLIRGALFSVFLNKTPKQNTTHPRLGLVIGKRNAPLAVSRNALKRVIREAFRHMQHDLPANDYVCRLQVRIPDVSLTELKSLARQDIDRVFSKVKANRHRYLTDKQSPPSDLLS